MREETLRPIGILSSIGIHLGLLVVGGMMLIRQPEFSVQGGQGSTDVELVASAPEEVSPTKIEKSIPPVSEVMRYDDVVQPKLKKEKPASPVKPAHSQGQTGSNGSPGQGGSVSARPDYLRNPSPPYPEEAKLAHQEGVVLLLVQVSENGDASEVSVKQSSGFHRLDEAALQAVRKWKFKPGTMGGFPVKSQVEVPVRFRLESH